MRHLIIEISSPLSFRPFHTGRELLRMLFAKLTAGQSSYVSREERFATILREHGGIISGICFAYCGNEDDLKDLRQDILLNIWKGLDNFRGESSLTTWLYRVALNTCVSTIRKRRGNFRTVNLENARQVEEEIDFTERERLSFLHEMISSLSPLDKAVITMWLDERSYDEIALVTGISRNNVAVRINRIKKRLAEGSKGLEG